MTTPNMENLMHPYEGLRIVECADYPSGELTGQLFAQMGAEVIKVERPSGAYSRRPGPFAGNVEHPEKSLNFWYYNTNKKSVTLDLHGTEGRDAFEALLKNADLLITTWQPFELRAMQLDYEAIQKAHPKLVIVSVTPFGLTGPYADYLTSDLVSIAMGGPLISCGYDDHSIPPIKPGGPQSYHTAASFAQIGALMALVDRQNTGRGQIVDVSMHESLAVTVEGAFPYWVYSHALVERQTCRHAGPFITQPAIFLCADGRYVYLVLILAELVHWKSLVKWMDSHGLAGDLTETQYHDLAVRQANFPHIQDIIECFFLIHDAEQMFREGQMHNLPIGILNAPEDLLDNKHFRERGFFVSVDCEEAGEVLYPGGPARYSGMSTVPPRRAPKLGEHNDEILAAVK